MTGAAALFVPLVVLAADERAAGDGGEAARARFAVELAAPPVDPVLCPTRRQVADALDARMPGIVAVEAGAAGTRTLRLTLTQPSAETVQVAAVDGAGATVLERSLDVGARGAKSPERASSDCAALADTVALIVERYLREIGYRSPPPSPPAPAPAAPPSAAEVVATAAPPPRPFQFFLGAGSNVTVAVVGRDASNRPRIFGELSGELHLRRVAFSMTAGFGQRAVTESPAPGADASLEVTPVPLRAAVGLRLRAGPGHVLPGLGVGVDLLWITARQPGGDQSTRVTEPVVEAGAAYLLPLGRLVYLKLGAAAVLNLHPHDLALAGADQPPYLFRTPRLYARGGLDLGVSFGN